MSYEQRELAYSDLRVFVGAYREAISQGLIALPWGDAPDKGEAVSIALKPPFLDRSFLLHGEISERRESGVVVALQPLASDTSFELDAHVALLEGVLNALSAAIEEHVRQGAAWKGLQVQPCTGSVDSGRALTAGGLQHLEVSVDELMPYLYLHRTHLENRELFVQMSDPVALRTVLHVHLGLPYLGQEVELRGVVARQLSDGIFIDLAPYPRSTRKLFEWYWRLVEKAAAEMTALLAQEHGQAAVDAIRALLPRASAGIADVVSEGGQGAKPPGSETSAPGDQRASARAPSSTESATPATPVLTAPDENAPDRAEAAAEIASQPEPAPSASDPESALPNIFTRRRSLSGRTRARTSPTMDALASSVESSMRGEDAAEDYSSGAPVIPVLLGDASSGPSRRSPPHETLTAFERTERPVSDERQALSRMIGRGSAQLGSQRSPRQRGTVATSDFVSPPVPDEAPPPPRPRSPAPPTLSGDSAASPKPGEPSSGSHADIDIFKRPSKRTRAQTNPPTPPSRSTPSAESGASSPPRITAPPAEEVAPVVEATAHVPPAPEPTPIATSAPEPPAERTALAPPAPSAPPAHAAPARVPESRASEEAIIEDDLIEDELGSPLRPPKGSLSERSLIEVLGELYRQNATGILKLQGDSRLTTLSFRKGRVTHIAEDPPQDTAMIGAQFITLGVSKHEMSRAINESKSENKLLGRVLLESKTIIKAQVKQALISQLKMRIGTIDGFESASYEYIDAKGIRRDDAPNVDPVKLLFRGRFEYYMQRSKRENQVESHAFSGSFVRQRNRGRRWINRFGLSLPQQGAWELIESGELKLSQLYPKLSVDQTTVFSTLFALRDFGCVEFRTKQLEEQTREALEKRFQEKMDVLRTGNQFDILDVHWTSTDTEVQKGYNHSIQSFDTKHIEKPSDLMRSLSKEILPAVEEAYELLKVKQDRVAYRESIMTPEQIRSAAEHLIEQGDMELFKNDLRLAREKFRRALELVPSDKKLKRKLNDTFTISGQAAAQSETKVEHKPAVLLPGDD